VPAPVGCAVGKLTLRHDLDGDLQTGVRSLQAWGSPPGAARVLPLFVRPTCRTRSRTAGSCLCDDVLGRGDYSLRLFDACNGRNPRQHRAQRWALPRPGPLARQVPAADTAQVALSSRLARRCRSAASRRAHRRALRLRTPARHGRAPPAHCPDQIRHIRQLRRSPGHLPRHRLSGSRPPRLERPCRAVACDRLRRR